MVVKILYFLALQSFFWSVKVEASYPNIIDVDDILAADFMPGNLLMLDNPEENLQTIINSTHPKPVNNSRMVKNDGGIMGALDTMLYHRDKMNEFLCRNFVAEQIIEDMSITRLRKRAGNSDKRHRNVSNHRKQSLRENLIDDEGSSKYKSWLTKSTTLEDIYKHYQDIEKRNDEDEEDSIHDIDVGTQQQITGYAYIPKRGHTYQLPAGPAKVGASGPPSGGSGGGYSTYPASTGAAYGPPPQTSSYGHGHGFSSHAHAPMPVSHHTLPSSHGFGFSGPLSHHSYDDHMPSVHHTEVIHEVIKAPEHSGGGNKGMDTSKLFEIALTALAFLAFKVFLVHVVLCISHHGKKKKKKEEKKIIIIIQTTTTTTAMPGGGRKKRELEKKPTKPTLHQPDMESLNELARHVLTSIESALVAYQDDGVCLRRSLCQSNKYSRSLGNSNRLWIPIWTLGMSWLAGKISPGVPRTTSMLDALKASVLGLGNGNCAQLFAECDLRTARDARRRRKRK